MSKDLKVVGAGHLGLRVALLWQQKFPESKIYLKTRSDHPQRSEKWIKSGFTPLNKAHDEVRTPYVVFCAPPTGNDEYDRDVAQAASKDWTGDGAFVFTGSGGVYVQNDGSTVNESSPVDTTKTLVAAEQATVAKSGVVMRFGGLYTRNRGAHNFWLKSDRKAFSSAPNGLINLIHYDDAASLVLAALLDPTTKGQLYLASDGLPISRIGICQAALKCPDYKDCSVPDFGGDSSLVDGKKYDPSKVKSQLNWSPKFQTFANFMASDFDKEMSVAHLL